MTYRSRMKIRIRVSLPPKALRSNFGIYGNRSRFKISRVAGEYRREAVIAAKGPAVPRLRGPLAQVTVRYIAFWPSLRNRLDPDNLIGAMKRALDGVKKAGVIVDDNAARVTMLPPQQYKASEDEPAGVVIEITEATVEQERPEKGTPNRRKRKARRVHRAGAGQGDRRP